MENFVGLLKRHGGAQGSFSYFGRIDCGKFSASVQASRTHYCTPRETLPNPDGYTAFEVAIFESDSEGEKWVTPPRDERFKGEPWAELFEDPGKDASTSVAGRVPRAVVQQIIDALAARSAP